MSSRLVEHVFVVLRVSGLFPNFKMTLSAFVNSSFIFNLKELQFSAGAR